MINGSWISCINPFRNPVNHYFFRYTPESKYFHHNDVAKICPTCWHEAQIKNGTLQRAPRPNKTNSWQKHSQSRPEKDSL